MRKQCNNCNVPYGKEGGRGQMKTDNDLMSQVDEQKDKVNVVQIFISKDKPKHLHIPKTT